MEQLTPPQQIPALRIQLARVALVSAPDMPWIPEEASQYMDVHAGSAAGKKIGEVELDYNYETRHAWPHASLDIQGQGIGTEIYTALPFLPLPGGEDFLQSGFRLRTPGHSDAANRLWESLVRKGLAQKLDGERCYEMLPDVPRPARLEVTAHGMIPSMRIRLE